MLKSVKKKLGNSSITPIRSGVGIVDAGAGTPADGSEGNHLLNVATTDASVLRNVESGVSENETWEPSAKSAQDINLSTVEANEMGFNGFENGNSCHG